MASSVQKQVSTLKHQLGSWMYSVMKKMPKDMFAYVVRTSASDKKMSTFYMRLEQARATYKKLVALATEKQIVHVDKLFFNGIRFLEDQESDERPGETFNLLQFEITPLNINYWDVSKHIPSEKEFNAYGKLIADALHSQDKLIRSINVELAQEASIIDETMEACAPYLEQMRLKEEKKQSKIQERKAALTGLSTEEPAAEDCLDIIGITDSDLDEIPPIVKKLHTKTPVNSQMSAAVKEAAAVVLAEVAEQNGQAKKNAIRRADEALYRAQKVTK